MKRTPEVIDAWFDSGSMPFAQWHFPFENHQKFERYYPADFIAEGIDQTRGWFYSLLAIATGLGDALRGTAARVVGVSPIIAGAAVRGMADACLSTIGVETSAEAVGLHYGSRSSGGLLDAWLVDETDAAAVPALAAAGIRSAAVPLWMRDVPTSAAIAAEVLAIAAATR